MTTLLTHPKPGSRPSQTRLRTCAGLLAACGAAASVCAAPVSVSWPVTTPANPACVAAAPFAGYYATGDTYQNQVDIRDVNGNLIHTIARADILALAPWLALDGGQDGPCALAFSPSGRSLYVSVESYTTPTDGLPSDVVLRYDIATSSLTLMARLELFNNGGAWPHLASVHNAGKLYVGTGFNGQVAIYTATETSYGSFGSSTVGTWTLPGAGPSTAVNGLTFDRDLGYVYAATNTGIYRAAIPASVSTAPSWTNLATDTDIRGLAWGDHYGSAASQRGLYILTGDGAGGSRIDFIPVGAVGFTNYTPLVYTTSTDLWHSISFTADGKLLVGTSQGALMFSDSSDTRLSYNAWLADEFSQVLKWATSLVVTPTNPISPGPAGWVIDTDVTPGSTRFGPVTPDSAGWTTLLFLMDDYINHDPNALPTVRSILTRYAGLASDGIVPVRNADGITKHWLSPTTGNTYSGWTDEYATLSQQMIVVAAARAVQYYPDDVAIANAASRIIFRSTNWSAYFEATPSYMAFTALAGGGPNTSSWSRGYHEGIVFADQAGVYGSQSISSYWFKRSNWPTGSFTNGFPVSTASVGQFDAAFLGLYPALLCQSYRNDVSALNWPANVTSLRWGNASWTDDNGAIYSTVFSAGTSPSGYNADSLNPSNHPGNITTFPSLEALSAFGDPAPSLGAYAAYRKGARQPFLGGSFLYRRPVAASSSYLPNSAGMPDVGLGALGLCQLLSPGAIDTVLAIPYPTVELCPKDVNGDGQIDNEDLYILAANPTDINGDGLANAGDRNCLRSWLRRHEASDITGR